MNLVQDLQDRAFTTRSLLKSGLEFNNDFSISNTYAS